MARFSATPPMKVADLVKKANPAAQEIPVRLITPLLGAGHTAGIIDAVTPISGKAIRGQLRFWWRATAGAAIQVPNGTDPTELLLLRESELFGSTESPSAFDLEISGFRSNGYRHFEDGGGYGFDKFGAQAYALFAAKQKDPPVPAIWKEDASFTLRMRWLQPNRLERRQELEQARRHEANRHRRADSTLPDCLPVEVLEAQFERALWAWLNFGGLGSHSRRGLGSVSVGGPANSSLELMSNQALRHAVPQLSVWIAPQDSASAMAAWAKALSVYQSFRQGVGNVRGQMHKKTLRNGKTAEIPGRSHWPEPDSLRQITGCALRPTAPIGGGPIPPEVNPHDHSTAIVPAEAMPGFPRAVLGLPILFHFADSPRKGGQAHRDQDPVDATLAPMIRDEHGRPEVGERMTSPVFTRPLYVGGKWRPAIVILRGAHLSNLQVHVRTKGVNAVGCEEPREVPVPYNRVAGRAFSGLKPMHGTEDAVSALEVYAAAQGFTTHFKG